MAVTQSAAQPQKVRNKIRTSMGDKIFDVCNTIFLCLLVVVTLYPFLNTIAVSFNDANDSVRGGIYLLPREWTLYNYEYVFSESSVLNATMISVLRTVIGTVLTVFCSAMVAYTISRPEYVLRKFVTVAFILTMYINGGLIPGCPRGPGARSRAGSLPARR